MYLIVQNIGDSTFSKGQLFGSTLVQGRQKVRVQVFLTNYNMKSSLRFKGGTLLIVQGRNHLEHCAYIGEGNNV